ncbi:glycosyltransferase [Pararhodobacter sp. SW119]|uniref:glycosyltransferase family 32 protein n=1 Tax=Pararhodobacter sp. SW119 TaxID=2780075 RepID=UPI001AE062A1|nr:glycosyltransferase [Pararhodobacter sp. SW119]
MDENQSQNWQPSVRQIGLGEAVSHLQALKIGYPASPILHQYWNADPPQQIRKLLKHNATLCERWTVQHEVWDEQRAKAFLAEYYPDILPLFLSASHPAMGSDLLRLCIIEHFGGLYLDADMALRATGGERLAGLLHGGLVFKWNLPERTNVPNWCFGFRAGHSILAHLIADTAVSMRAALQEDSKKALQNILTVSGPGRFTRSLGGWIAAHGCPPGFLVLDVDDAYTMVQNGPELLGAPLDYKSTSRHWLVAARSSAT